MRYCSQRNSRGRKGGGGVGKRRGKEKKEPRFSVGGGVKGGGLNRLIPPRVGFLRKAKEGGGGHSKESPALHG